MRHLLFATLALPLLVAAAPVKFDPAIEAAVAAPTRKAENRPRDKYRHPVQTLGFFGVKPTQTVVEFVPGGGWYTEILAPLVKDKGQYIALVTSQKAADGATAMLADTARFGRTTVATLDAAAGTSTVPAGSADMVLTFRNIHNLTMSSDAAAAGAFRAFFAALKPGGILGVVDHRLPESRDSALERKSGYLKRSTVVRLATEAGFRLVGESEVNANPKDTADWAEGVWTLPPVYALKDQDRAKYAAIGESDRMTLKFEKPKP